MQAKDLIGRCIERDAAAWELLVSTHGKLVLRVLVRILGPGDEAAIEDLEQEVYARLLARNCEALRSVESPSHLKGLLARIASNLAKDHRRRMKHRAPRAVPDDDGEERLSDSDLLAGPLGPEDGLRGKQSVEEVLRALDAAVKPPHAVRDKLIFRAHYFDEMSAPEIAAMKVGLSTKGVESVLYRLTQRVREALRRVG